MYMSMQIHNNRYMLYMHNMYLPACLAVCFHFLYLLYLCLHAPSSDARKALVHECAGSMTCMHASCAHLPPSLTPSVPPSLPAEPTYTPTHIHTYACKHKRTHMHEYIHAHIQTFTHAHINTYTHTHLHTHAHTDMHAHIHPCRHTHMANICDLSRNSIRFNQTCPDPATIVTMSSVF